LSKNYDAIVIGLGGMGSATAYHLAGRGVRVLGLDSNPRLHSLGSSHGRSRIIREAYKEAPEYVPLVQRAYELWRELEDESGRRLLTVTGGLVVGAPGGESVAGVARAAREHGLSYEEMAPREVATRFPALRLTEGLAAVFEERAGILHPEECTAAHLDLAADRGADLRHAEQVRRWKVDGTGVRIETDRGTYHAQSLVITVGPWAGQFLADLGLPLTVRRVVNAHFEALKPATLGPERLPVYILDVPEGQYYGFPNLPGQGLKIGRHDGGEVCTPQTIRRAVDPGEVSLLRGVLDRYVPGSAGSVLHTLTCMYTNTPDGHFVIDAHPDHDRVVYGCGFSGHGYKFASVIAEVLADLATEGRTECPVGFLSADRFA
jgi:sarcosine oxidase